MTKREILRSAPGKRRDRCSIRFLCCGQVAVVAFSCGVVLSGRPLSAGQWWLVLLACGETQEEQLRVSRGNWSDLELAGTC